MVEDEQRSQPMLQLIFWQLTQHLLWLKHVLKSLSNFKHDALSTKKRAFLSFFHSKYSQILVSISPKINEWERNRRLPC